LHHTYFALGREVRHPHSLLLTRFAEASSVSGRVAPSHRARGFGAAWIALGALAVGAPRSSFAQAFSVTPRSETYVPIAQIPGIGGITAVTFSDADEDYRGPIDLGFSYRFLGQTYTQLGISTNGWVGFGPAIRPADYQNSPIPDAGDPNEMIAPFWDDLADGTASYGTIGTAPSRTFVIELSGFRNYNALTGVDDGRFQVWLFEGLERFEVKFGGSMQSSPTSASSGFEGIGASPFGSFSACGAAGDCTSQAFNGLAGMAFRVERSRAPELTGSIGQFPRGAAPGASATGPAMVQNLGIDSATHVVSNLYLSTDAAYDAGDLLAGTFAIPGVAGGGSVTVTATLTVPAGAAIRDYYLILSVDAPNAYPELDERNNLVVAAERFATGADLAPASIAPHDVTGAIAGQPIMFDVGISQNGIQRSGPVVLEVVASPDRIWDVNDPPIGRATVTLSGAVTETFHPVLTLPQLAPGQYYPIVIVDAPNQIAEYDELNNVAIAQTPFPTGPDLAIGAIDVPASAVPGGSATISTRIASIGVPFSGVVAYRLLASADMRADASDTPLGASMVTFAGEPAVTDTESVLLPSSLAAGRYYVVAVVDPQDQIAELDETNNAGVSSMQIIDGYDLAVEDSIAFTPSTVEAGDMLTVTGRLLSMGAPFIGRAAYRIYLSDDFQLGPTDVPIHDGTVDLSGSSTPFTAAFPVPSQVPAASRRITVAIDPDHLFPEADRTNNSATTFDELTIRGGDVRVESIAAPHVAFIGESYPIDLMIANDGPTDSRGLRYAYYLSPTDIVRRSDPQIFMSATTTIAAGDVATFSDVVQIPALTSTATRFLGVILSPMTPDPDPTNNIGRLSGSVRVVFPIPDLTGRIIETSTRGAAGEPLFITRELDNLGLADSPLFTYAFYLSTDRAITPSDLELGRFTQNLPRGGSDFASDRIVIPSSVAPGTYFVGSIVDPDDVVDEVDESNNTDTGPEIQIFPAAIRFLITSLPDATLDVPYEAEVAASGGPLPISWSIAGGALPDGFTIDTASGIISGTARREGLFRFVLRASSGTSYAEAPYVLRVVPSRAGLAIATTNLPPAIAGRDYAATLVAIGGAPPYSWRAATELPDGLTLSSTGALSGRASAPGTRAVTFEVSDAHAAVASKSIALNVFDASDRLVISENPLAVAQAGADYCAEGAMVFAATGGAPPYAWRFLGDGPPGMTLSSEGAFCGVPERVGSFAFTVRVHDAAGLFDTALFVFDVSAAGSFAIFTSRLPDGVPAVAYDASVTAVNGAPPVMFSLVPRAGDLPPGLAIDPLGRIRGTPMKAGLYAFAVQAVDARRAVAIEPLSIAIADGAGSGAGCRCDAAADPCGGSRGARSLAIAAVLIAIALTGRRPRRASAALTAAVLAAAALAPGTARAQLVPGAPYYRTVEPIAYRSLANPTRLTFSSNDDGDATVDLPFSFEFYGAPASAITVGTNGAILLRAMGTVPYDNHAPGDGSMPHGFIAAVWDDLVLSAAVDHDIATEVEGSAPNRAFTIEWRNVGRLSATGLLLNFSIRLFEGATGRIEIDYGPTGGTASSFNATMGMEDNRGESPVLFSPTGCTDSCSLADVSALSNMRIALTIDKGVDLAAVTIDAPRIAYVGGRMPISYTVANLHSAMSGPFTASVLLSTSQDLSNPTVLSMEMLDLAPFESHDATTDAAIPLEVQPGLYRLGLVVDALDRIQEVDETNNRLLASSSVQVAVPKPDLTIRRVLIGTASVAIAGRLISVTSSVANIGGSAVSGASVAIMLSANPVITSQDLELGRFGVSLDAGRAAANTMDVVIPMETASGAYWVGALSDPMNSVDELSESNNGLAAARSIAVDGRGFAIATAALPVASTGLPYSARIVATGGDAPFGATWHLDGGRLPSGLTLISSSGEIIGTPSMAQTETFTVSADAGGDHDARSLTLIVVDPATPLAIVTLSLPLGFAGAEYAFQLIAIGATRGSTLTWSSQDLPAGVTLSADGLLGGVPEASGTSSITVTVTDSTGAATRTLALEIAESGVLTIVPEDLETGLAGAPYHHPLRAVGGLPPIVWNVGAGQLPAGVTLTPAGVLEGTPAAAGSYRFTVEAHDTPTASAPEHDANAFELSVVPSSSVTIATGSLPDAVEGEGYDQSIRADGGTPPLQWTIRAGRLPDGLAASTNPATGSLRIAGQPRAAGVSNLLIHVEDGEGRAADRAFALRVLDRSAGGGTKSGCGCRAAFARSRAVPRLPLLALAIGAIGAIGVVALRRRTHIAHTR
jgi:putative Ig domain-containing protein/CARDB protein